MQAHKETIAGFVAAALLAGLTNVMTPLRCQAADEPPTGPAKITFRDVTTEMGITNFQKPAGKNPTVPADEEHQYFDWPFNLLVGDFNNDGWPDLYCGQHGTAASGFSHLFLLDPQTKQFKILRGDNVMKEGPGRGAYLSGVVDMNDDGLLDLVFTDGDVAGTLARNITKAGEEPRFEKAATFESGSGYALSQLGENGPLYTFISANPKAAQILFQGVGTDKRNAVADSGLVWDGHRHGNIIFADFNGDGLDDALVAEMNLEAAGARGTKSLLKNRLRLFLNKGHLKFEEITDKAGLSRSCTGNIAVADLNNDGSLDIVALGTENTDNPDGNFKVFLNDGTAHFKDVSPKTPPPLKLGWEMDIRFNTLLVDLDNDGLPDLVFTSPYGYCRNNGDGTFGDFVKLPAQGTGGNGWAVAADFNNDGKLDLAVLSAATTVSVLQNETASNNRYLKVQLSQKDHNVFAIGARIVVYAAGMLGDVKGQLAMREIMGNNMNSVDYAPLHIGVGPARQVDLLVVFPNGKVVEMRGLATNQTLKIADTEAVRTVEFQAKGFPSP